MPPSVVAPFVERVPMCLGGYDPDASTATDYAWFIWSEPNRCKLLVGADPSFPLQHIPPCRERLTKREDRALALRCVPGFVPPSVLKRQSRNQAALAFP